MHTFFLVASESPVKSVTVSKASNAEVLRTFDISLQPGLNKVIVTQLPTAMDPQSARISGLGLGGATHLSDVFCSVSLDACDSSGAGIAALQKRIKVLMHQAKVLNTQAEILIEYAKTLNGSCATPDMMSTFLASFTEQGNTNTLALAKIDAEIEQLEAKIQKERERASLVKGSTSMELTAIIHAKRETNVEVKLRYLVHGPTWKPNYELHAITDEYGQPSSDISLHYRAHVTQSTGEDWTGAALTLSTASLNESAKVVPRIEPLRIKVVPQVETSHRSTRYGPPRPARHCPPPPPPRSQSGCMLPMPPPPPAPAAAIPPLFNKQVEGAREHEEETRSNDDDALANASGEVTNSALVAQTPVALSYTVAGNSTIPSDGKDHLVTIAVIPLQSEIEYVSVPRVDPRVYLQCKVKNTSDYRLLPGLVSIILDDGFVSRSRISDVNHNDDFNFTLGDDTGILVSYARRSSSVKEGSGSFADILNVTAFTTLITIKNKHTWSIENLVIRDALPTTEDKRVKVVLKKPTELIEAKEGNLVRVAGSDSKAVSQEGVEAYEIVEEEAEEEKLKVKWLKEKDGLYEYRWRVDPDEEVRLETQFEMRASTDLICSFDESRR